MSFILSNGAVGGVAALPSQGYSPDVTSKQIKMLLRQNTFMPRVCNRRYQGELKGRGSKLIIPGEPNVTSSPYVPGQPLITQVNPKATDIEFFPNRARYIQTALTKEQEYFSAIGNLAGLYKSSGIKDIVIAILGVNACVKGKNCAPAAVGAESRVDGRAHAVRRTIG
jgi:hypothetical protein